MDHTSWSRTFCTNDRGLLPDIVGCVSLGSQEVLCTHRKHQRLTSDAPIKLSLQRTLEPAPGRARIPPGVDSECRRYYGRWRYLCSRFSSWPYPGLASYMSNCLRQRSGSLGSKPSRRHQVVDCLQVPAEVRSPCRMTNIVRCPIHRTDS